MSKTKKVKKGHTQSRLHKSVKNNKFLRVSQPPSNDQEKLSWHIRILDFDGPWGWGDMDAKTLKYVHGKLAQFETMTWAEVNHPNTGCHPIKVRDLCRKAQKRLAEIQVIEFEEELFASFGERTFMGHSRMSYF